MATSPQTPLVIQSLRGGMNDTDPSTSLPDDQCVLAENVEFFSSALGERRNGCDPLDLTNSGLLAGGPIGASASTVCNWGSMILGLSPIGTSAIAADRSVLGGYGAGASSFTLSFPMGATASYLLVGVVGDIAVDYVTGVTFNGVAMTLLKKYFPSPSSGLAVEWLYLYGLMAPATGTHNIVVSASHACSLLGCEAVSYINVSDITPNTIVARTGTAVMSVTDTILTATSGMWAVHFSRNQTGTGAAVGGVLRASESSSGLASFVDSGHPYNSTAIVHLSEWFPTNTMTSPEFWAVAASPGYSTTVARRNANVWIPVLPTDPISSTEPSVYEMVSQSLNGNVALHFLAYLSGVDRLHVWDGSTLRRTGLAQPPAAAVIIDEGSGSYATTRYFRYRYVERSRAGIVLRRSEPSASIGFTPSGSGAGSAIFRTATLGEGETDWEIEGSIDNANFYRIATVAVTTTSYNDETAFAVGYSGLGPLSEDIGDYLNLPSAKYLAIDGNRLLFAGHQSDTQRQSTVGWTPVFADPGVGNNERLPLDKDNTVNLDNGEGGPITGITDGVNGVWYVFKWSRIYQATHTGSTTGQAYSILTLSSTRGAIAGSVAHGVDEYGSPCIYFLDPLLGPSRVGTMGIQTLHGLRTTWARVNLAAAKIVARGCYYPYKQQIHYWLAVDGSDLPNFKMVLQISNVQSGLGGTSRGWSVATGRITEAYCVATFTETVTTAGVGSLSHRPFIGLSSPDFIQRCDVDNTDAGVAFTAKILTHPYALAGLLGNWGILTACLLANANATQIVAIDLVIDMGKETLTKTIALAPEGLEPMVIKDLDDLAISGARLLQIRFRDPS